VELLQSYYAAHRRSVEERIAAARLRRHKVVHISVHSFAPVLDGRRRMVDVGVLYDPSRPSERLFSGRWRDLLQEQAPLLRVRLNQPYRGAADGFTTALRRKWAAGEYTGIELEINQALLNGSARARRRIDRLISGTLGKAIALASADNDGQR
jgi:predicted N-formylglutamate amidohydrolase